MDLNLKEVRIFSSDEERAREKQEELARSSEYGHPDHELGAMYSATKVGKFFFQAITLASTSAFIYRVSFSHVAELAGTTLAGIFCAIVAVGASVAIEKMLEGNHVPFWKKLFVKGQLDVVLLGLAIIFSGIVIGGAYTGMQVVAEDGADPVEMESVTGIAVSSNEQIAALNKQIQSVQNCQVKGGYCWKGKLTDKGMKRIESLESEKESIRQSLNTVSNTTAATNQIKVSSQADKLQKAQRYLGQLALACEAVKIIIFVFWGYRSLQLNQYMKGGKGAKKPIITSNFQYKEDFEAENEDSQQPSGNVEAILDWAEEYRLCSNARNSTRSKFKALFAGKKGNTYEALARQWRNNENRFIQACDMTGREYIYEAMPKPENTSNY